MDKKVKKSEVIWVEVLRAETFQEVMETATRLIYGGWPVRMMCLLGGGYVLYQSIIGGGPVNGTASELDWTDYSASSPSSGALGS